MGLEVAEIAELAAALRPIQTTAVSGALATAEGSDDHDAAAAAADDDTGSVTPTASRERDTAWAAVVDGAAEPVAATQPDRGADVDTVCYATPTACRTAAAHDDAAGGDAAAVNFTTPTSEQSALKPATVCPPAPRKMAPALKRKLAPLQQRLFYPVPLDLATVFKPGPPAPPAAKKMRAHVVESSLPLGT